MTTFNLFSTIITVRPPNTFGFGGFLLGDVMADKVYCTPRKLVKKLRSKGMSIQKGSEGSKVIKILRCENYYNVINGYKDLFVDKNSTNKEVFVKGTTFEEVYSLFCFDRNLRNIFLKYLLKVENKFKTIVSDTFSENYGNDNYLVLDNFDMKPNTSPKNLSIISGKNNLDLSNPKDKAEAIKIAESQRISSVTELFGTIQKEISKQLSKHNNSITHYMTKYGYVPLWVLVNILTFGKISDFYFNMKEADKNKIGKELNINYRELHKAVESLALARNYCAHGNRFFDIRFKKSLRFGLYNNLDINSSNFKSLGLKQSNGNYLEGCKDLFSIVILFTQFLQKNDIKEFVRVFENELSILEKNLHTISINHVLRKMGFPSGWKCIVKLC